MAGIGQVTGKQARSLGDAAVDGLFAGLAAGVLMGIFLLISGLAQGKAATDVLGVLMVGRQLTQAATVMVHLAVSGIYGVLFGMGLYLLRPGKRPGFPAQTAVVIGLGYGLVLALVARAILLPGSGSSIESLGWLPLLTAHGLYGLSLGVFTALEHRGNESS